ncbi:MAG: HNH endonuclease [Candidatus Kryptoniota bacterium]
MNSLEQTLVSKAGFDNGWEFCIEQSPERIMLASARHPYRALITASEHPGGYHVEFQPHLATDTLLQNTAAQALPGGAWEAFSRDVLAALLQRAAELAMSLPDAPERQFQARTEEYLAAHPDVRGTEAEVEVKRRIGQDIYREALMQYWHGCCAVTACDVPELLRASHAKPWKDASDAERLDVYNGFLLRADLDALFDAGLITFSDDGDLLVSPRLTDYQRRSLGLDIPRTLRWIEPAHRRYLAWHREYVFQKCDT